MITGLISASTVHVMYMCDSVGENRRKLMFCTCGRTSANTRLALLAEVRVAY